MHNDLLTPFWKNALQQLPPGVRERHVRHIESAERWELRLNAMIETWSRAKARVKVGLQGLKHRAPRTKNA
jgi:hypothetical protein